MTGQAQWPYGLSDAAERDYRDILAWTAMTFDAAQADRCNDALRTTLARLGKGPRAPGVLSHEELAPGLRAIRVKIGRRKGRHIVFFTVAESAREIIILRILHDAMDPGRHIPASD